MLSACALVHFECTRWSPWDEKLASPSLPRLRLRRLPVTGKIGPTESSVCVSRSCKHRGGVKPCEAGVSPTGCPSRLLPSSGRKRHVEHVAVGHEDRMLWPGENVPVAVILPIRRLPSTMSLSHSVTGGRHETHPPWTRSHVQIAMRPRIPPLTVGKRNWVRG